MNRYLLAFLFLSACASTPETEVIPQTITVDHSCDALREFFPFVVSRYDSDVTKSRAFVLTKTYQSVCPEDEPTT